MALLIQYLKLKPMFDGFILVKIVSQQMKVPDSVKNTIAAAQRNEITEHYIYEKLAAVVKDSHNREVLTQISRDELDHYNFWKEYTGKDIAPNTLRIWMYFLISRIFGLTFGIKLMEKGEEKAQETYEKISESIPSARTIIKDEDEHEKELIALIDEEHLTYIGALVLGLNDALVELTGALAGFTFALQDTRVIATVGLITGIAAALSMAASEYLSIKAEEDTKNPRKASVYTGGSYVATVVFLILPYALFQNYFVCLGVTIMNALIIIFVFTFYVSVAKDLPFKKRFLEMAFISLGIAAVTFAIGVAVRVFLNIDL